MELLCLRLECTSVADNEHPDFGSVGLEDVMFDSRTEQRRRHLRRLGLIRLP